MSNIKKHQMFVIVSGLLVLSFFLIFVPSSDKGTDLSFNLLSQINYFILISFLLISTIGISHGALDGKIIWVSGSKNNAFKLYCIYILISLLGLIIWYASPSFGLLILLSMSIVHFGSSDLMFLNQKNIFLKLSWGITMGLLPILFHTSAVENIFFQLTSNNSLSDILKIIQYIIFLNLIFLISYMVLKMAKLKESVYILLLGEIIIMILMAYYLHPLVWFGFYFCFLHGIRGLINNHFKFIPDFYWLLIFTLPISFIILFINHELSYDGFLIVFPIIAGLTISHMLLPSIIRFFGSND